MFYSSVFDQIFNLPCIKQNNVFKKMDNKLIENSLITNFSFLIQIFFRKWTQNKIYENKMNKKDDRWRWYLTDFDRNAV